MTRERRNRNNGYLFTRDVHPVYSELSALVDMVVGLDWIGAFHAVIPDMYLSAFLANKTDRASHCVTLSSRSQLYMVNCQWVSTSLWG